MKNENTLLITKGVPTVFAADGFIDSLSLRIEDAENKNWLGNPEQKVIAVFPEWRGDSFTGVSQNEIAANIQLVRQAFMVASETGLTPEQLLAEHNRWFDDCKHSMSESIKDMRMMLKFRQQADTILNQRNSLFRALKSLVDGEGSPFYKAAVAEAKELLEEVKQTSAKFETTEPMPEKKKHIGYAVLADCTLDYTDFEEGQEIIFAGLNDNEWKGTGFFDTYPNIFKPIYE